MLQDRITTPVTCTPKRPLFSKTLFKTLILRGSVVVAWESCCYAQPLTALPVTVLCVGSVKCTSRMSTRELDRDVVR